MDMDDICMEYDDLVEAGEINPGVLSLNDYIEDKLSELMDRDYLFDDD